ncbi:MAG: hypothetical protein HYW02_04425 [Deltaproteobacteria bacterium]|nr:hypothetical protein [Deltaproteobacteria bacterium]MBI2500704.1 hypothetical protein [Deltaproteobacteria bacterium]MBI4196200.1 hypothetical protein [Deltaproteobacteria bacterium]
MPARTRHDIAIVDRSPLARNMYQVLFSGQDRFHINFTDEFQSLFKRSPRLKPDLLIVNSNALPKGSELRFPCATVMIVSKDRLDLKESAQSSPSLFLLEKPFYPYDLLSVANRLIQDKKEIPRRGRPPGRSKKK